MTEILKRLLGRAPLLVLTTIVFFWLFSSLESKETNIELPLFYNPNPMSVEQACSQAFRALVEEKTEHVPTLSQLGGSCLPQLLPQLRRLRLHDRRQLALALWPIAERMGLAEQPLFIAAPGMRALPSSPTDQRAGDMAIIFWEQFQEDRALDFKSSSVKRLVQRLSVDRLSLRELDLLRVDTYALPLLVKALGRVESEADIERVHRISSMISHDLEKNFSFPGSANREIAKAKATEIRYFWDEFGPYYTPMNKLELSLGRLVQTQFGLWVSRSWRSLTGKDFGQNRKNIWRFALMSFPLLLIAACSSLILAPLIVGSSQLLLLGRKKWQRGWVIRSFWAFLCSLSLMLLLTPSEQFEIREEFLIAFIAISWTAFILQREITDRIDWRIHQVLKSRSTLRKIETIARWVAPTLPTFAPLFASQWVVWVICSELSGGRDGWGYRSLLALKNGDLPWLMTSSISLTFAALVVQIVSDLIIGRPMNRSSSRS